MVAKAGAALRTGRGAAILRQCQPRGRSADLLRAGSGHGAAIRSAGCPTKLDGRSRLARQRRAGFVGRVGISRMGAGRSEEHTSELQSLMRISYAVFCLKKKKRY